MTLTKACNAADCPPGKMKGAQAGNKRIFVANVNGAFYACSSRCTHMGGPLEEGKLEANIVTCPWHGSRFDVSNGKVVRGPAGAPIPTFKVEVNGDEVMVDV